MEWITAGVMTSNLKIVREHFGKTLAEVADAAGTDPTTVAAWENGDRLPGTHALLRLAAHFRLPADVLLLSDGEGLDGAASLAGRVSEPPNAADIDAAITLFQTQLMAMKDGNMLPLDDDTIEFCLQSMRGQLEEDARSDDPLGSPAGAGTVAEFKAADRSGKPG